MSDEKREFTISVYQYDRQKELIKLLDLFQARTITKLRIFSPQE